MVQKVIVIAGPTASGKTGIGVRLAKEFNGEIVSADSRQVYRGLDLGTGKDLQEYDGVKYHMIDIVEPGQEFSMFKYLDLARLAIEDIFSRGKFPIIVGGTGLYIQGLVEGFSLQQISNFQFPISSKNSNSNIQIPIEKHKADSGSQASVRNVKYTREELDDLTVEQLNNILEKLDPEKHNIVDRKNRHRLIRAIELAQEGMRPVKIKPDFEALQIAVDRPRQELHKRIDQRVDERFNAGMLEEVIGLLNKGVSPEWLMGLGLEYRVITEYILRCHFDSLQGVEKSLLPRALKDLSTALYSARDDKRCDYDLMVQDLKYKIHQYARRQITWFKRFPEVNWLSDYSETERFVKIFLSH